MFKVLCSIARATRTILSAFAHVIRVQNVTYAHIKLHALTRTISGVDMVQYIQIIKSSSFPGLANKNKVFQLKNNGFHSYPEKSLFTQSVR